MLKQRLNHGQYHTLFGELRLFDREYFFIEVVYFLLLLWIESTEIIRSSCQLCKETILTSKSFCVFILLDHIDSLKQYFRYLRMSPNRLKHLLSLVRPFITKNNSYRKDVISPEERLVITLRYLATGDSQQSQAFNFRVGRSTVCGIIKETCFAIWCALKYTYLTLPSTRN